MSRCELSECPSPSRGLPKPKVAGAVNTWRRSAALVVMVSLLAVVASGCFPKQQPVQKKSSGHVELVYYKLFDDEDVMQPLITQYQAQHPNVTIKYRKFVDPLEYENLIINELAEGQGPDIFSAPNFWFLRNSKKISPMPVSKLSPQQFDQTFVSVASRDLAYNDPIDGVRKVFGLPMTVDTLALYYNKAAYEDAIPARGRPAATWEGIKDDVYQLTKKDNSFERFQVAGIAMGRSDNIARAIDILYLLMIQMKVQFYNDAISQATFGNQQVITSSGFSVNPASEALKLYTGFALPSNKNYSWNNYLASPDSAVKELETFARGKVAMIFGYSYLYEQIKAEVKDLKDKGVTTIDPKDVRVSVVPQLNDPAVSTEKRDTLANYYAETVARTSAHPDEAWDFLAFLSSKDAVQQYSQKTHKPTSRRDMIEDQKRDTIYGPFAEQIGFAESFPIYDDQRYRQIFGKAIDAVLATTNSAEDAMKTADDAISALLPQNGLAGRSAGGSSAGAASSSSAGSGAGSSNNSSSSKSSPTSASATPGSSTSPTPKTPPPKLNSNQ